MSINMKYEQSFFFFLFLLQMFSQYLIFLIFLFENDRLQSHLLRSSSQRTHLQFLLQRYNRSDVEECSVGLCATCICSHTESHIQKRTAPDYENIRSTYSKMQDSIRSRISAFEQEKSRIVPFAIF